MEGGLRFNTSGGGSMQIASTDAGLANFGELTAYPSPVNTSADTATYGASFVCAPRQRCVRGLGSTAEVR